MLLITLYFRLVLFLQCHPQSCHCLESCVPPRPEQVHYLENIYKALQSKRVPHTDCLVHSISATVFLKPKGVVIRPSNEEELLEALVCVLWTLLVHYHLPKADTTFSHFQVLHQDLPLFHQDIRWLNVIQSAHDPSSWFLIDWEDAAGLNNAAVKHIHTLPSCYLTIMEVKSIFGDSELACSSNSPTRLLSSSLMSCWSLANGCKMTNPLAPRKRPWQSSWNTKMIFGQPLELN